MTVWTGRRTLLKRGREADYRKIHATIPEPVARALQRSGVISWRIWIDGRYLFHAIETQAGYDAMMREVTKVGTIDKTWDDVIATLLESEPNGTGLLDAVWSLDAAGQQHSGTSQPTTAIESDGQMKESDDGSH